MNNEKTMLWAMALIALVVIAIYISKHYENFEASLSAGPIKLDLRQATQQQPLSICRLLSKRLLRSSD